MGASCYAGSMSYIDVSGSIEQEHMFPAEISRRVLSLGRDKHDGSSITTQFEIDDHADLVSSSFKVYLTTLSQLERLSYSKADEEIERCETLGALYDKVVSRKAGEKGD